MLESFKPITDNWWIFLIFLTVIAGLFLLERYIKKGKLIFEILNLVVHTAMLFFCITIGAGPDICLIVILGAVLMGLIL